MASVVLVGATGLVGSHILKTLQAVDGVSKIATFSRKPLPSETKINNPIVSPDSSSWPQQFPANNDLFISALGTTRAAAGGFENQRKIDYDLNVALAQEAAKGTKVYVLISSSGANSQSMVGYPKMKGELEDAVASMGFKRVIILRPGLIVGARDDTRIVEAAFRKLAGAMGAVSNKLKDFWAQDDEVIARAAVRAGLEALKDVDGKEKVTILGQADVVRLGRTEWDL
ncbi:related to Protein fmp52-1, mitochondrial [Ramularia collo-cygni]|uniref:Related to Protein fmp52-1, mitochondrial n=1 Tax=Ramularia collo-cygni TaxID=112498 RepID=A0A2D3URI4_9PEZI|nr:related to Protein fmp52-1, mitochondrial [Ramularia collo-cygni]CZT17168.1 related to Protein fmp52-1, mitochondrial [Ramularia collo-cygni]